MISALLSLYSPHYPTTLIYMLQNTEYRALPYLAWFWRTQDFSRVEHRRRLERTQAARLLLLLLRLGILVEIATGLALLYMWLRFGLAGFWGFGLALLLAYPIVWAHLLAAGAAIIQLVNVKRWGRALICTVLERQARALRLKYNFAVVAVTGSVGKTSTKLAIATLLQSTGKKVIYQEGNYNDRVTVPLVLFGQEKPASLYNVAAWLKIFARNYRLIRNGFSHDVAVLELGSDGPGQIAEFAYLEPDLAVITAVSAEHMEFFQTLDAVAEEELSVASFSKKTLINGDDIDAAYSKALASVTTYGLEPGCDYRATWRPGAHLEGGVIKVRTPDHRTYKAHVQYIGSQGAKVALAAFAAGATLQFPPADLAAALPKLEPFAGRMRPLKGKHNSILIDDTYNASPLAVKAALDVLYATAAPKRIAILGDMNELGNTSKAAHEEIGAYCDPKKLDLLITLGKDANQYLAEIANQRGCTVTTCSDPYEAGERAADALVEGAVVLVKGSQNGVFAEEALKTLLADPAESSKLVRQSAYWMRIKHAQFDLSKGK